MLWTSKYFYFTDGAASEDKHYEKMLNLLYNFHRVGNTAMKINNVFNTSHHIS